MSSASIPGLSSVLLAYALTNRQPSNPAAFRLLAGPHGVLGPLTAACFLIYHCPEEDLHLVTNRRQRPPPDTPRFILVTAPTLLQQLNRANETQRQLLHGQVRGRIDWSATYKARYCADTNPAVFVCLQSQRQYDRPENQVFVFLLQALQDCLSRVPHAVRLWHSWAEGGHKHGQQAALIGDLFAQLGHRLRLYSSHAALQGIHVPPGIETRHLLAATTNKNELYADVAAMYRFYHAVVAQPVWSEWRKVVGFTIPLPAEIGEMARTVYS